MRISDISLLTAGIALSAAIQGQSATTNTWDGGAAIVLPSDNSWSIAANWVEDAPPGAGAYVVFDHRATELTNVLDVARTLDSLDFTYTTNGTSSSHVLDLNGLTLTVTNLLAVGHERTSIHTNGSAQAVIRNGTLQLGNAATVQIANGMEFRQPSAGILTLGCNAAWQSGRLAGLLVGSMSNGQYESHGTLDLSAMTNTSSLVWMDGITPVAGTLNADKLHIGYDPFDRYESTAAFKIGTAMTQLIVKTEFFIGVASSATLAWPTTNIQYRIGVDNTARADMRLTVAGGHRDASGIDLLWAPMGGTFRGYLGSLQLGIGSSNDRANGFWKAILDLTGTTVEAFDVSGDLTIGGALALLGTGRGQGTLRLPAVTARVGGNLVVDKGGASGSRSGLLELYGTQLTVEGDVIVNAYGVVRYVYQPQNKAGNWFLRTPGNKLAAWQSYLAGGLMTASGLPPGATFGVWMNGGYTYLGLPPAGGTVVSFK